MELHASFVTRRDTPAAQTTPHSVNAWSAGSTDAQGTFRNTRQNWTPPPPLRGDEAADPPW
jgi:hypothetical protein